jgi:hypothetical protein
MLNGRGLAVRREDPGDLRSETAQLLEMRFYEYGEKEEEPMPLGFSAMRLGNKALEKQKKTMATAGQWGVH